MDGHSSATHRGSTRGHQAAKPAEVVDDTDDGHENPSGSYQPCGASLDLAADDVEH